MRVVLTFVAALALAAAVIASTATPQQAESFARKLSTVLMHGDQPPSGRRTEFHNDELNAYLQLRMAPLFPDGVSDPGVTLVGQGRVSARAIVDLDVLRQKSSGGWFDPAAYLAGRLPVTAVGTLKTSSGVGQLLVERAEVSGIPVPVTLLQQLVTYYTTSPDLPDGVNLDAPFELPQHIQQIEVGAGHAIVVQ